MNLELSFGDGWICDCVVEKFIFVIWEMVVFVFLRDLGTVVFVFLEEFCLFVWTWTFQDHGSVLEEFAVVFWENLFCYF